MTTAPTVSVSIITYNNEKYIAQAIKSVLWQQTNFKFEIVIGDDFSTDNTRQILRDYQRRYPNLIQLILHPKRYCGVPGRLNNITNIYACRGKYIALLDGDDFWVSPNKLQQQVDTLEANHAYVAIANQAKRVTETGLFTGEFYGDLSGTQIQDSSLSQRDILKAGWCLTQTSSLMFRNKMFREFPDWFWNIVSADFGLILILSQYGKILFSKEVSTAYRVHEESFTAQHSLSKKNMKLKVKELRLLRKLFLPYRRNIMTIKNIQDSHTINHRISMFKYGYASHLKNEGNLFEAFWYLTKASLVDFSLVHYFEKVFDKLYKSLSSNAEYH